MQIISKQISKNGLVLKFDEPVSITDIDIINNIIKKFVCDDIEINWFEYQYVGMSPFCDEDSIDELINIIESLFKLESKLESQKIEKDPEILISELPNEVLVQVTDYIYDQLLNHIEDFGKIEIFNTLKSLQKIEKNDNLLKFNFNICITQPKRNLFDIIWKLNDEHKLKQEPIIDCQSFFETGENS